MGDREENLIKLLRSAMHLIHSSVETGPPSKYLRQINELDPRNMFTETADGLMERNTFFDICCKVHPDSCHLGAILESWPCD